MMLTIFKRLAVLSLLGPTLAAPLHAQELTGDEGLACQAMLCLSSATRPTECAAALSKYFSISFRLLSDTLSGRLKFLHLCPVTNTDPQMGTLADALVNGAGRCDAASLNVGVFFMKGTMPDYCTAYYDNPYVDLSALKPIFLANQRRVFGNFITTGYWVDPVISPAPASGP